LERRALFVYRKFWTRSYQRVQRDERHKNSGRI